MVRHSLHLSQRKFYLLLLGTDDTGLSSVISKIETGRQVPPAWFLNDLGSPLFAIRERNIDHLGISADWLLFGHEIEPIEMLLDKIRQLDRIERRTFFDSCTALTKDSPPDMETLGELDIDESECCFRLRHARKALGLRQKDLGLEKSRVSRNEVHTFADTSYLVDFFYATTVPIDYILHGTFPSLPPVLQSILLDYSFPTQKLLIKKFCEIARPTE